VLFPGQWPDAATPNFLADFPGLSWLVFVFFGSPSLLGRRRINGAVSDGPLGTT